MESNTINTPTISNKDNTIYAILSVVFILLVITAVYLFVKIKSPNKNTVTNQTKTEVTTVISPSPVASESVQVLEKFDNSDFKTEYYSDMELVDSALENGKKYSFVNNEITYQIFVGTDWMEKNPLRNFDNKETSINNIPSYNYTDAKSYLGFDFVSPSKKYVTIKCIYDVNNPNLINNCSDLVNSFYLYNP